MPTGRTWVKMLAAGAVLCIGGPALVSYVTPTEEELFKRYNPDLQRRSLQNRTERQQEFDDFVNRLKEASKSDKPIWDAMAEIEAKRAQAIKEAATQEKTSASEELEKRRQEMRSSTKG